MEERHEFESVAAMVADNNRWHDSHDGSSSHEGGSSTWNGGTASYDAAVALIEKGWRDGAKRVEALRQELDGAVQSLVAAKSAAMVYGVEGDHVDIGRVVTGDPECCGDWSQQGEDRAEKVVKIVANISVSAAVNVETMFARGAACLAAVDILESLDRRVELWAAIGLRDCGKNVETHILIKPASQPAELDRLAYVLCHASFFRRVVFAHMELNRHDPCRTYPAPVTADDAIVLAELLTGRCPSKQERVQQVIDICKRAGIIFSDEDIESIIRGAL